MPRRGVTGTDILRPLLDLIEQRFDLCLSDQSPAHLHSVFVHYDEKRRLLLRQLGEAAALKHQTYAKAVLISETTRLMLREIDPWPRRKMRKSQ